MTDGFTKDFVTKSVRAAAVSGLPTDAPVYNQGSARCYLALQDSFLCLSVQHRMLRPERGYRFCVNYGIQPRVVFEDDTFGFGGQFPTEMQSLVSARLSGETCDDQWWHIATRAELEPVLLNIQAAAERAWLEEIHNLLDLERYLQRISRQRGAIHRRAQGLIETHLAQRIIVRQERG